ncbi:MAG: nucleotide exchange factor GrpE [Thermoanaerobaculia bacterium]
MNPDGPYDPDEIETEELDLGSGEEGSIEDAMQEALKAVEKGEELRTAEAPFGATDSSELASLRDEVRELRDKSMRTLADFDNFRKRIDRERSQQRQYAGFDVLKDFLQVVDNLERALGAEGDADELRRGVELILKQMGDLLKQNGVERVPSEGRFDPVAQEAVVRHESDEVAEPTVVKELQAGYRMRDRLLRAALVEVAVPASAAVTNDDSETES